MRHLGIDYGTRRVGIALSDESGRWVTPLEVLEVNTPQQAADRVAKLAREEGAQVLVVGLPLNMDETEGPAAKGTRAWAAALGEAIALPVVFVDERLSSFEAEQMLAGRKRAGEKLTHRGKKKRLDAVAAAQLLQAYLDGRLAALSGSSTGFQG